MIYKERLKEWLDQIYEPVEGDISCRELMDRLPPYVDAIVQEHHSNGEFAAFQQHMSHCTDCSERYEALLVLAQMEESDRLPEIDQLLAEFADPEAVEANSEERVPVSTI